MSIAASDVKFYKAQNNNDQTGNGGPIADSPSNQIVDGQLNNAFPNVSVSERTLGVTRYRKIFLKNENLTDLTLQSTRVFISDRSTADDYFRIKNGTDTDTQADAVGYSNWSGAGILDAGVNSGETSLSVDFDVAAGLQSGGQGEQLSDHPHRQGSRQHGPGHGQ